MILATLNEQAQDEVTCVVRVSTTVWANPRGLHAKKSLTFLRRQCKGINLIEEAIGASSPIETLDHITNWSEVADGIYTVEVCDKFTNWESGYVEDWAYKLVLKEEK